MIRLDLQSGLKIWKIKTNPVFMTLTRKAWRPTLKQGGHALFRDHELE